MNKLVITLVTAALFLSLPVKAEEEIEAKASQEKVEVE